MSLIHTDKNCLVKSLAPEYKCDNGNEGKEK